MIPYEYVLALLKGVINPVETRVNARLKLYGGKGRESGMQLEATVIGDVEGLSLVVLVARATSRK